VLTIAQKRRRAKRLKTGVAAALAIAVLTPKLDNVQWPEIGFPLVATAVAAPSNYRDDIEAF
jgi:hypothetical protein